MEKEKHSSLESIKPMRRMQDTDKWVKVMRDLWEQSPKAIEGLDEVIKLRKREDMTNATITTKYPAMNTTVNWTNFPSLEKWEAFFKDFDTWQPWVNYSGPSYASMEKDLSDLLTNPPKDPIEATIRRLQHQGHLPKALKRK